MRSPAGVHRPVDVEGLVGMRRSRTRRPVAILGRNPRRGRPSTAACSRGRRSSRRPAGALRWRRCSPACQCVLNTVPTRPPADNCRSDAISASVSSGRAAVDEHQAVGGRERQDVGAAARHERQSIVQRNETGLLGAPAAWARAAPWQDACCRAVRRRLRQESADDRASRSHHRPPRSSRCCRRTTPVAR